MRAVWNGQIVAESDDIITVEGNAYFPTTSLRQEFVQPSSHTSVCGWKGTTQYYTLSVDGQTNKDAVWYYPEPKQAAADVTGRVAFWKGVSVSP